MTTETSTETEILWDTVDGSEHHRVAADIAAARKEAREL